MTIRIMTGDALARLRDMPDESVQCCVTSPPYYGLRSYLPDGHPAKALEIGLETTPDAYVAKLVEVFREVRRVLRNDGVLFLNLGDSFASGGRAYRDSDDKLAARGMATRPRDPEGIKPKDLIGVPWMVAFALRADGWWLRSDIVWAKPNPMPESVADRPTRAHEYVFLLTKSEQYFYDAEAVKEEAVSNHPSGNGFKRDARQSFRDAKGARGRDEQWVQPADGKRNARSVWTIGSEPFRDAHYAVMPSALAERCILAGSRPGDTVLDPFGGAGTTAMAADRLKRDVISIELYEGNVSIAERRLVGDAGMFAELEVA